MADYKRMISYMYQYENGLRRKNVGYARIEAKNGQCKITLHMQLPGQLDSIFPTYLIHRDMNGMDLIYLGDALLKNQIMDSKLTADEKNVMNTGFGLAEMGGLLLFLHDNVFFATEWDDIPIIANEVLEALRPKKQEALKGEEKQENKKQENEKQENEKQENVEDKEAVETEVKKAEETGEKLTEKRTEEKKPEDILSEDSSKKKLEVEIGLKLSPEGFSLSEELNMPKYKLPRGWKTIERLQRPLTSGIIAEDSFMDKELFFTENEDYGSKQGALAENQLKEVKAARTEDMEQAPEEAESQEPSQWIGERAGDQEEPTQTPEEADSQEPSQWIGERAGDQEEPTQAPEEAGDMERLQQPEGVNEPENPVAEHLFNTYPRIYPFEDNEILLCVKIEPKEIGMLPKELWPLSNNSFLMHGYYCYHHLIFAKMKNKCQNSYILGIPGIYHNRERFMARMFGFECFKSIRKRDLQQGDFGYWYMEVFF